VSRAGSVGHHAPRAGVLRHPARGGTTARAPDAGWGIWTPDLRFTKPLQLFL